MNITINNSNVTINTIELGSKLSTAKDELLNKLYYARNKDTLGGYDTWKILLDFYFEGDYDSMRSVIEECRNSCTRTRCLRCLDIIENA